MLGLRAGNFDPAPQPPGRGAGGSMTSDGGREIEGL